MRRLKYKPTFDSSLMDLRNGVIEFDEFVRRTSDDWRRLARHVFGRWTLPDAVEAVDVEQELMIGAWKAAFDWDPSRGTPIGVHVRWCAITAAKKWIHRQRGSLRIDDRNPSRHPLSFASLGFEREAMDDRSFIADQENAVATLRLLDRGVAQLDEPAAWCVYAMIDAAGDTTKAAKAVNGNQKLKLQLRLNNETEARQAVCRAIRNAVRYGAA